jgi:hypothetical protein
MRNAAFIIFILSFASNKQLVIVIKVQKLLIAFLRDLHILEQPIDSNYTENKPK